MINKKIWNINLPVLKSAFVTNISPKQYDTASNLFKIALYKDMEKYDLTGLTVQAVFKKADGTISYLPCTITNAASGELEIDITSQVLAIAAEVECEIRITGTEGELLIAPKFYFKVYESLNIDGAVESQDEFPVLVELLNRVETVETELQNITPEQIAQVTTNEQTRQDNEAARQLAEAERAGFYAGFNAQLAETGQRIDNLVTTPVPTGEIIAQEIIDARQGAASLGANITEVKEIGYSNSDWFNPTVVAQEKGRHLAFGSICRVAELASINTLDVNLVAYRSGNDHQFDGKIRGVLVSNFGTALGEPFTLADPVDYPAPGRNGNPTLEDYRDPNLLQLPDGRILVTFVAESYINGNRSDSEAYVMIGTWSATNFNIQWSTPVLQFPAHGNFFYGKPFVEGDYIYSAIWTDGKLSDSDGNTRGFIGRASLSAPDNFEIIGNEIYVINHAVYSEPVLRPRPNGGYFLQVRYEGASKQIHRFDSDDLINWSVPVVVYNGSAHAKGLEILEDGRYFTGIRYINSRPGAAILTTSEVADTPVPLFLSAVIYSSQSTSAESGYMEFQKIKNDEYLGMFHTEGGESIRCFNFTLSMIMDKRVKASESIYPIHKPVSADKLDHLIHVGDKASTSHNLLANPILFKPFGFSSPPSWRGATVAVSDGTELDSPGIGYPKITISAGSLLSNIKLPYSRLFKNKPIIAAARIYCETPNRLRIRATHGAQKTSPYHSGRGWETLVIISKNAQYQSLDGVGLASNPISFEFAAVGSGSFNFYVDWASAGFGETVPEVVNDSLDRLTTLARVELNAKTKTFILADLGFPSPTNALTYAVNILDSTFEILGYSVTKTATGFTITLADGTSWGGGKMAILEVIGI